MQTTQQITNEAINRVIENNQPFSKIYYAFAENWIKTRFKPFNSDDVRKAFLLAGNEPPRNPKAYGGALFKLSNKGLIFNTKDTIPSQRPEAHNRPLRIWISAVYKAKQSNNARKDTTLNLFEPIAS
jgi:hypothetical protein